MFSESEVYEMLSNIVFGIVFWILMIGMLLVFIYTLFRSATDMEAVSKKSELIKSVVILAMMLALKTFWR